MSNPFFQNYGPFEINELLKKAKVETNGKFKKKFFAKKLYKDNC